MARQTDVCWTGVWQTAAGFIKHLGPPPPPVNKYKHAHGHTDVNEAVDTDVLDGEFDRRPHNGEHFVDGAAEKFRHDGGEPRADVLDDHRAVEEDVEGEHLEEDVGADRQVVSGGGG